MSAALGPLRDRVTPADTFLIPCMLAFHVDRLMCRRLAPILFADDDSEDAMAQWQSPVEKAEVSESA